MGQFEWGVAGEGYVWREARATKDNPAVPRVAGQSARFLTAGFTLLWKRYQPLTDTPALFRTFADTPPTEAGVQAFANAYGLLGLGEILTLDGKGVGGEDLRLWQIHIEALHHTLIVWDALLQRDLASLERWFTVDAPGTSTSILSPPPHNGVTIRYTHDTPMRYSTIDPQIVFAPDAYDQAWPFLHPGFSIQDYVVDRYTPRDAAGWALVWLHAYINYHLSHQTAPYLGYSDEASEPIPLSMQIMPKNLCGALWLQVALAIRGTERFQHCQECHDWFHVPPKARRANTKYCSTKCRVRAARHQGAQPAPVAGA